VTNHERSWEFAAIPLTLLILGILGILFWAFTKGLSVWLALGVVVLAALTVITVRYMARTHAPGAPTTPSLPDGAAPHIDDGVHRVLVIADDACSSGDLETIAGGEGVYRTDALVVAPALGSRTARWTGDERSYEEAAKHLEETLAAMGELDVEAAGRVGSHDPLQAADDALREFPADEIVFVVHASTDANWLEDGVVESARARYPLPVTELVVRHS
jgi:hypothetical protein